MKLKRKGIVAIALAGVMVCSILAAGTAAAIDPDPNNLQITGSTTVYPCVYPNGEADWIDNWAGHASQSYSVLNPGSGGGIKAILGVSDYKTETVPGTPTCDIGMSSADLDTKGVTAELQAVLDVHIVAWDALAVIINDDMAGDISNITLAELKGIYEGDPNYDTWGELSGYSGSEGSEAIIPRARILESGTRATFLSKIGCSESAEETTIAGTGLPRLDGNPEMAMAIGGNLVGDPIDSGDVKYQIGYVGMGFLDYDDITGLSIEGYAPTAENQEDYPLGRLLYCLTRNDLGTDPCVESWKAYKDTGLFAARVVDAGFVPQITACPDWDVNGDGKCLASDITGAGCVRQHYGDNTGDDLGYWRADVNNDGKVLASDITASDTIRDHYGETWP